MERASKEQKIRRLIVLGRTGSGKSRLCNQIAGKEIFKIGDSLTAETTLAESKIIEWPNTIGDLLELIDTQGFGDNRPEMTPVRVVMNLIQFLQRLGNGFHVGLFCIPAKTRVDAHDLSELNLLGMLLGSEVFKYMYVVITQTNTLNQQEKKKKIDLFKKELPELLLKNNLPDFKEKILIGDFDDFEPFMKELSMVLYDNDEYRAQIPKEINLNDPNSLEKFLATPQMKQFMGKIQNDLESLRKLTKEKESMLAQQAEKNKYLAQELEKTKQEAVRIDKNLKEVLNLMDQKDGIVVRLQDQMKVMQNEFHKKEEQKIQELENIKKNQNEKIDHLLKLITEEKSKNSKIYHGKLWTFNGINAYYFHIYPKRKKPIDQEWDFHDNVCNNCENVGKVSINGIFRYICKGHPM